ncbi:hypothetical protein KGM_205756 [Danaus plexippus plexippus]|uniref:Uncharacterized protein n=1 Tax=Danaus plexippus plexippus TaxID=278856 RepID=A0A212F0W2_DANPL|nr:hypothetical protein KGM_205756 [Danaus plexippus plexippus]
MDNLFIYTAENIIKVVGLLDRKDQDGVVDEFQKITRLKSSKVTFRRDALNFIHNGCINSMPNSFPPTKNFTNKLEFIMNKPLSFFDSFPDFKNLMSSMSREHSKKINQCFLCLNRNQQLLFLDIHRKITDSMDEDGIVRNPFFMLLNSRSGTGKSTLISVVAASMCSKLHIMVYSNNLRNVLSSLHPNIVAMTNCKFIMEFLGLSYYKAISFFTPSADKSLCYIYRMILKSVTMFRFPKNYIVSSSCSSGSGGGGGYSACRNIERETHLFVFDEVTLLSPFFVMFLKFISEYKKINILMVGDANQQKTIRVSKFHKMNNLSLLDELVDCSLKLNIQMRTDDKVFMEKIAVIETELDKYKDNIKINYAHKLMLFELFEEQFLAKEDFKTLYFASKHQKCKDRVIRMYLHAKSEKLKYYIVAYKNNQRQDVMLPKSKFMSCLILVEKYPYIKYNEYVKNENIVEFQHCDDKCETAVVRTDDNRIEQLKRIKITNKNTIDDHLCWLREYDATHQFPLKPNVCTFYSCQGLTIKTTNTEVDIDDATLNAVYVGITRVRRLSQLKKMHTRDLLSLIYTKLKNDEFYYKLTDDDANAIYLDAGYEDASKCNASLNKYKIQTNYKIQFQRVSPKYFDVVRDKSVLVSRRGYDDYYKSNFLYEQSQIIESYKYLINENIHDLIRMKVKDIHNIIKCTCESPVSDVEDDNADDDSDAGGKGASGLGNTNGVNLSNGSTISISSIENDLNVKRGETDVMKKIRINLKRKTTG